MIEELCETGKNLWDSYRYTLEENIYKDYVNHMKSCSECIQKLGLTREDIEILNDDGLEPIGIEKFENITDTELVEEIKRRGIKIEIPGNNNISSFGAYDRPHCYYCDTICTPITEIRIGGVIFDIEKDGK